MISLSFFSSFFGAAAGSEEVAPGVGVWDLFSPFDSAAWSTFPLILSNRFFNNSSHSRGHLFVILFDY